MLRSENLYEILDKYFFSNPEKFILQERSTKISYEKI